ncbi:hypothetical protein [Mucilaginibacter pallidiroseus]|uniref:hypothetical protein n=1 Tax=Mucilaginibacter pallidiroseus TaxID=2599295 RepID=UPI0011B6D3F5|nr:hypothetical protein [Mucilaginibacter pallidiroseus]
MNAAFQSLDINQLSVGSVWQNIAFYITILLACAVIVVQLNANKKIGMRAFFKTMFRVVVLHSTQLIISKVRGQASKLGKALPHSYLK